MPGRPTTLAYGKAGACCADGLSSFSNASSVGRRLDILKYCGLGHYNPVVVVSYIILLEVCSLSTS